MYPIFCIHSSVEGHLGSSQLLAIINKAAMNIVEHVSFLTVGKSSGYMPRRGIVGSSGSTMSNFLRNCQTDFQSYQLAISPARMSLSYQVEHLLDICPGEVLRDPPVVLCPIFWGTARLISRVVVQACNPTNNGGVFLFLHILASICCHLNFWS